MGEVPERGLQTTVAEVAEEVVPNTVVMRVEVEGEQEVLDSLMLAEVEEQRKVPDLTTLEVAEELMAVPDSKIVEAEVEAALKAVQSS